MMKKLMYILSRKEKKILPLLFAEIVIGAILETIGVSAILPIINILLDSTVIEGDGYIGRLYLMLGVENLYQFEMTLFVMVILFYVIKNVYLNFMRFHQNLFINHGQRTLTNRLMRGYFSQPYSYFTQKNPADLQRNVVGDVGKCYQMILAFLTLLTQGLVALTLIVFLLISDWLITVIMIGAVGLVTIIFLKITSKLSYKYGQESRTEGEKVIQWINQSFGGIKEIKLFNRESFFIHMIDKSYGVSSIAECKVNVISGIPNSVMETICIIAILFSAMLKLKMGGNMQEFITILAAFALAAIRLIPVVGNMTSSISRISFCKSSIEGLFGELSELENKRGSEICEFDIATEKMHFSDRIEIQNITFRYPDANQNVLTNINFFIKKGESVAFIGPSGAGKTPMADILLGILKPGSGAILVDDCDVEENIYGWYKQIGYIPQNIYLMDDTIRNNVAFGLDEKQIDDEKVWNALRKAQLEEFVKGLPEGIHTNLGDRGVRCSGGQRQRLGIARALYDNPEVLILDEATSALDNETEKAIMEAIDGLKGEKTLLIIAHRLSTIKNCDSIYKIEKQSLTRVN